MTRMKESTIKALANYTHLVAAILREIVSGVDLKRKLIEAERDLAKALANEELTP